MSARTILNPPLNNVLGGGGTGGASLINAQTFEALNTFAVGINIEGVIEDSLGSSGTSGQVLTSLGTTIKWEDATAPSGGATLEANIFIGLQTCDAGVSIPSTGGLKDSNGSYGALNDVLISTGTAIEWVPPSGGGGGATLEANTFTGVQTCDAGISLPTPAFLKDNTGSIGSADQVLQSTGAVTKWGTTNLALLNGTNTFSAYGVNTTFIGSIVVGDSGGFDNSTFGGGLQLGGGISSPYFTPNNSVYTPIQVTQPIGVGAGSIGSTYYYNSVEPNIAGLTDVVLLTTDSIPIGVYLVSYSSFSNAPSGGVYGQNNMGLSTVNSSINIANSISFGSTPLVNGTYQIQIYNSWSSTIVVTTATIYYLVVVNFSLGIASQNTTLTFTRIA